MRKVKDNDVFAWLAVESRSYPGIDFKQTRIMVSQDREVKRISGIIPKRRSGFKPILSTSAYTVRDQLEIADLTKTTKHYNE